MKTVLKVFLMTIAYLALFILGAWSGARNLLILSKKSGEKQK